MAPLSHETKRKISEAKQRGGIHYLRKTCLRRDNYTCVMCGFQELGIMEVDHIIEKGDGGKTVLENLQTLCPTCHTRKTIAYLQRKKVMI